MDGALDQLEKTVIPSVCSFSLVVYAPQCDSVLIQSNNKPPHEMTKLIRVLLGMSQPSARTPVTDLKFFDPALNASQKEAVKFALEAPEVACIHGPPGQYISYLAHLSLRSNRVTGTGKTHTLIEIIRQLTNITLSNPKPQRLLVCGASNLSVDNILERLLALPPGEKGEKPRATRIGHPARVMSHEGVLESTLDAKAGRTDQVKIFNERDEILPDTDILWLLSYRPLWRKM